MYKWISATLLETYSLFSQKLDDLKLLQINYITNIFIHSE